MRRLALLFAFSLLASPAWCGPFDFNIVGKDAFSETQQVSFDEAAAYWKQVILGYAPGITQTVLTINVSAQTIDGVGGTIGLADVTLSNTEAGFTIATEGQLAIDIDDLINLENSGFLPTVIGHEFGHLLGIGTEWIANNAYVDKSGQYTGTYGLAAYQREFDHNATFVPVELNGGETSADSHWEERNDILDSDGKPLAYDLMTGFLSPENYLTWTTIQSLRDIGYEVIDYPPDPIPGDYNGDQVVDTLDFVLWRDTLGSDLPDADGDGSGTVGLEDYDVWKLAFGNAGPGMMQVPEPSLNFALIGSTLLLCRGAFLCRRTVGRRV